MRAHASSSASSLPDTMLIPIKLQISIQFNFLTITNHHRAHTRREPPKPPTRASPAKLKKERRPADMQSMPDHHYDPYYRSRIDATVCSCNKSGRCSTCSYVSSKTGE
ncbi:uncharacterized protein B0H18DRAFT_980240 [Fomitopsis serialis]|uniref:uncharacterized protein n=1 Tax=Fomitopsis serialis TaxID=139415 RepID=UPI002008A75D|nr:uncharacterized protein B0H18DRAFT_980240 [Neoantrodia serialis]KAH9934256.1 hypothetical protein B0H18DRAFT_980240 [Neoantrodia serialis]